MHKYQLAYLETVKEFWAAGMLQVYDAWFISMNKQFLTIWINWMVEAAESLWLTISDNPDYKNWVSSQLKIIFNKNKQIKKITWQSFNTEFVPAENLWVKFATRDKEDWYKVNRNCYNSYFYVVEDDSITHLDKFILHGKEITQYLDGWSALHLNLDELLTKENAINILRISAKTWCNYFCTNVKSTICNDCKFINKETKQMCTKCWSKDIDYATRIIWYLKRISAFSKPRQEESKERFYHKVD
jgi:ribonucleoside-triphosphate reductase